MKLPSLLHTLVALCVALLSPLALAAGSISVEELDSQMKAGKAPLVIDVRAEGEFLAGHVPGARLIPHTQMQDYVDSLSALKDEPIVLYCRSGKRAGMASEVLENAGFSNILILDGSYMAWEAAGKPVRK